MHRPLLVPILLLVLVVGCRAAAVEVENSDELCDAIGAFAHDIRVTASFSFGTACAADIRHPLVITGNTGIVLDLCAAREPVLRVSGSTLSLRSISLACFSGQSPAPGHGLVPHIDASAGSVVYEDVLIYYKGAPETNQQLPDWAAAPQLLPALHHQPLSESQSISALSKRTHSPQALHSHQRAAEVRQDQHAVDSTLMLDVQSCYISRSTVVFDADSFDSAVANPRVDSITLIQDFSLVPSQCNSIRQAAGRRDTAIHCCPAANAVHQQLSNCLGRDVAAASNLSRKLLQDQQHAELHDHTARKEPQQLQHGDWPPSRSPDGPSSLQSTRNSASSTIRTLRQLSAEPIAAAASPAVGMSPSPAAVQAAGSEPQKSRSAPRTAANSTWLSPIRAAVMAAKYPAGNCFSDVGGYSFAASNAAELKRLLSDNAVTHIELKGNLVLTPDLFPPENANDKSKGMNISHHVEIRACTGDINNPITVDFNNLQQQIYVYGFMRWAGNMKFINSYPSPRRAGLYPLIGILSVEEDGIIEFEDLEIDGSESCPLFEPNNAWWSLYSEDPLSALFMPKPADFDRLSEDEVLLLNWKFNKSAWVRATQGPNGISLAVGDGYWHWIDVMVRYKEEQKSVQSILQIVLPVVLGSLALLLLLLGVWLWRRRRAAAAGLPVKSSPKDVSMACRGISMSEDNKSAGDMVIAPRQTSMFDSSKTNASIDTQELIEEARRRMQTCGSGRKDNNIVFEGLLGEGTFGKVYRGQWHGTVVAVKTMLFPAAMSGKEKREKMAIMETAISSSLSHPNIVQTYTYIVKPLTGELAMQALERGKGSQSPEDSEPSTAVGSEAVDSHGWEVRLVLELCDRGSLKELLSNGGLRNPETGKPDMVGIVATALDIARAMLHLHSENIIHSDLKARNVVLKSAGADARGFVAKVSDFGLSVRMDPSDTHVSNVYQGTLTHMAPEVLMYGKLSRASDVYAFGILLWELYTGQQAFKGTPRVLLGHEITKMGRRPEFPDEYPFDYQLLACRCWESDPDIRPSFQQILDDLQRMANKLTQDAVTSLLLTQQQTTVAATGAAAAGTGMPQQQHSPSPAAPAACGWDPSKFHKWEPQTSLLDLNTTGSSQGLLVPLAMEGNQQQQLQQHLGASHVPPCSMSWGTHSGGGGLWFGGSLAPSNVPSNIELPIHPVTAGDPGVRGPEPPEAEPAAAAQGFTALYGAAHLAAASHAVPDQHLQPQQQQQQHWSPNICVPSHVDQPQQLNLQHYLPADVQWFGQQAHHQQQQQQLLSIQELQQSSSVEPASVSRSAVCLQGSSSTLQASSFGPAHAAEQQQVPEGVGAAAAAAAGGGHQGDDMLPVAKDVHSSCQQHGQHQPLEHHQL